MDYSKLKEKLKEDAGTDGALIKMADFIEWLIISGNHEDIAEKMLVPAPAEKPEPADAGKQKKGKKKTAPPEPEYSLKKAFDHVRDAAKKLAGNAGAVCVEDKDVYWEIVKYFGLTDCVTKEEVAGYAAGNVSLHANAEAPTAPAPVKSSPFSVDIDSLFD